MKTILDLYVTVDGKNKRRLTVADFPLRGARIASSRERAFQIIEEEISFLGDNVEFIRVYDTGTMTYTDYVEEKKG